MGLLLWCWRWCCCSGAGGGAALVLVVVLLLLWWWWWWCFCCSGAGGGSLVLVVVGSTLSCDFLFCFRYHLLNQDPFPVLPLNVIMIMREFRGAFGLLLGKLAGPPLYYVTFKRGLTGRNLPRGLGRSIGCERLCSRKVRLSCSGLEWLCRL